MKSKRFLGSPEGWILVVGAAGFAYFCVMGPAAKGLALVAAPAFALLTVAPGLRAEARLFALLVASTIIATTWVPAVWPLPQLTVGGPLVLAAMRWPRRPVPPPWLARGRLDPLPIALLGALAAVALGAWTFATSPDLSRAAAMLPPWPGPALAAAAIGFSIVNAVLEEVIFRGVLQDLLRSWLGAEVWPVLLQGAAFGVLHWHGIPSGPLGALMAGSWGVMLGWARRRSHGLRTPILAHVVADAVIFTILAAAR